MYGNFCCKKYDNFEAFCSLFIKSINLLFLNSADPAIFVWNQDARINWNKIRFQPASAVIAYKAWFITVELFFLHVKYNFFFDISSGFYSKIAMSKFEFNIQNTFLVLQGNLHFSNSCMMMNVFLKKLGDQCDFTNKKFQGATKILPKPVTKKNLMTIIQFQSWKRYKI